MNHTFRLFAMTLFSFILFSIGCKNDSKSPVKPPPKPRVKVPKFERDSAYNFVGKQVAFGPRVPNSTAHDACRKWIVEKLESYGVKVTQQSFKAKAYTGTPLNGTNIIASFNPNIKKRVFVAAHWDSRHISDYDSDQDKQKEPVPGADDGGSGVGVLIEIARTISQNPIDLGVDLIFFDAEDYGESQSEDITSWCLGSQHWSKNFHVKGYKPKYGILLDMVGAKNARFTKEETSMAYAPNVMNKLWKLAQNMGYGNYFVDNKTRMVIDDHLFINRIAGIPTIDIINRPADSETGFGHYWHTHKDDMSVIDRYTLGAVGQTMLAVLYKESEGSF